MEPPSVAALDCAEAEAQWADLPAEALQRVFELTGDPAAVARAACACRAWRDAAQHDATWRALYAARWGALPAGSPEAAWRARCAGRHGLPAACLRALRDCGAPLRRGDALARCVALERAHPGVALRELQSCLGAPSFARAADRAVSELALAVLERMGAAQLDARDEAQTLLDAACAVALLIDPSADVFAARDAVTRLGAAARLRLHALGGDASPVARLDALNAFLFGAPADAAHDDAQPSLLDPGAPLPGAEGGCGLGGQLDVYYAARNSSLVELLRTRRGLPIVLAVLHVVVAAAAGVPLQPCGVPNQFMTRTPEGAPGEPQFVDVFAGGLRRGGAELLQFIAAMGIVPHEHLLAPTAPREVAARMIRNLQHLLDTGASAGVRPAAVLHLHSAALSLMPVTADMRLQRFTHACDELEVHLAQRDFEALAESVAASRARSGLARPNAILMVLQQQLDTAYAGAREAAGSDA